MPFKTVIKANIGDAHAMGNKPVTFIRQVILKIYRRILNKLPKYSVNLYCASVVGGVGAFLFIFIHLRTFSDPQGSKVLFFGAVAHSKT